MPREINLRREHILRERAFREREGVFAAWVKWYVFDPETSEKDNVYDESGEKVYREYGTVPILWWFDEEGGDRLTPEGRELQRRMTVAITVGALRNAGIDPESDDRINDMILFRGWFWELIEIVFTSQSSLVSPDEDIHGDDSTARVTVMRRYAISDMPYDIFPLQQEEVVITEIDGGGASSVLVSEIDGGDASSVPVSEIDGGAAA